MDSPPECLLSLSCEQPQSPPTLPSLDHSPQASSPPADSPVILQTHSPEPSRLSPDTTPCFSLSSSPLQEEDGICHFDADAEEVLEGIPASPIPAVALFPGGQEAGCSPRLDSSPPDTPSAPFLGYGALELALSSGQSGNCSEELDLQLFRKDTATRTVSGVAAASGPALRFPCHVCGKRFRFQSILSLHARAHSLDRDRRASALYRSEISPPPLKKHLKTQQNHQDFIPNHRSRSNQRLLPGALMQHLTEDEDSSFKGPDDEQQKPNFSLEESTPLTPPLTEEPTSVTSPHSSATGEGSSFSANASTFRCHACKGKFRTASELARHVRILHNPYKCTLCPFSASQEESLASHLQDCHPSPDIPAQTPSRNLMDTPLPTPTHTPGPATNNPQITAAASSGSTSMPAFRCDTCGQRFTQSWFLKGHMRKHKDSLDHKCQVCGRGFKEPWFLKNHMKVHLNKLGLRAGLGSPGGGADLPSKGSVNSQSLNALYSSLLMAQRGGGARGGQRRSDRETEARAEMGLSKSAILGYLGLPGDGGGASCMERLQAVAQVAEMGNGGSGGGGITGNSGGGDPGRGGGTTRGGSSGETAPSTADGGDQAAWWQLVARSLGVSQQQPRPHQQQQGRRTPSRSPATAEADRVRAFLGGLEPREETGGAGGSWECPDCGKLFRSLQQVVVHARVHTQRPQKGGRDDDGSRTRRGGVGEVRPEPQPHGASSQQMADMGQESKLGRGSHQAGAATDYHSVISNLKGTLPSGRCSPYLQNL